MLLDILIDAGLLMLVIKAVGGQDVDFVTSIIIAVVVSLLTGLVAVGLSALMGVVGLVLAGVVAAVLVGFAVSVMIGTEFKRACLIGAVFLVAHLVIQFSLGALQAVLGG